MDFIKQIIFLFLSVFIGCLLASGQEYRKEVCVLFKFGSSYIDKSYSDNEKRLAEAVATLDSINNDDSIALSEIRFSGEASPEGSLIYNKKLAGARMSALEKYIRERIDIPDSIVTRAETGIAWHRLSELISESDTPYKEEALQIICNVPEITVDNNGKVTDSRWKHLMDLRGGRVWRYIAPRFLHLMRNAGIISITVKNTTFAKADSTTADATKNNMPADSSMTAVPDTIVTTVENQAEHYVHNAEIAVESDSTAIKEYKPLYMSLSTNMLYDILAIPNIGIEFYLGKNYSIATNWMYAWWSNRARHRYWRVYGGDIAVRKWFGKAAGKKPLTGHHLGIYAQVLTYDFEFGGKGQMAGRPGGSLWERANYAAGIEYGYSLPVTSRLNIDFMIGIGYAWGKYYDYEPVDDHFAWQATKERHWIGPTKAGITLVWLLGSSNRNEKKK